MTTIIVDGPSNAGKTAFVEALLEAIPYSKLRQHSGDEDPECFEQALEDDNKATTLFPLITIWLRSWVSGWALHSLSTASADQLDDLLFSKDGVGIILLGDEEEVEEDEQVVFEDYPDNGTGNIWIIVEHGHERKVLDAIIKRVSS